MIIDFLVFYSLPMLILMFSSFVFIESHVIVCCNSRMSFSLVFYTMGESKSLSLPLAQNSVIVLINIIIR